MKNLNHKKKIILKTSILLITTVITFISVGNLHKTNAQIQPALINSVCEQNKTFWEKLQTIVTLDLRRTVSTQVMATVESAVMIPLVGATHETLGYCVVHWDAAANGAITGGNQGECDPSPEIQELCDSILLTHENPEDRPSSTRNWGRQLARGSLLSFNNQLEKSTEQPLPFNMAYYYNKEVSKVPYLGTALAQSPSSFEGPFLEVTYDLWAIVRNMAYGIIAVIMIATGLMIMTRKRINPQTMVTVQYAVPRIIIALALITFSYVIGATLASAAWVLRRSAGDIIYSIASANDPSAVAFLNLGPIVVLIIEMAAFIGIIVGTGGAAIMAFVAFLIVAVILKLIVEFKIFLLYVKMIINIVASPIIFATGAMPGKEASTANWFKGMASKGISIFAMRAIMSMTNLAIILIVISNLQGFQSVNCTPTGAPASCFADILSQPQQAGELFGTMFIMPLLTPLIFIFGHYQAFKIDKKIDAAIMGAKK